MAKRKVGKSSGGTRKSHGPKRHLFNDYGSRSFRIHFGRAGLFTKYSNEASFRLAVLARNGNKNMPDEAWHALWSKFSTQTRAEQDAYLKSLRGTK